MVTLDRDDITTALDELLDVLVSEQATAHIRIVGGAALAISFGRNETTADVDALYGSSDAVENAARAVARRRGWPDDWLNDKVKMFATHFDNVDDWVTFAVRDDVEIRIAGAPLLLAMKLRAARGRRDSTDIDVLLDEGDIRTVDEAQKVFERFYPEDVLPERAMRQLQARFPRLDG
jgi:predicted nucleotidyltransferase